MEALFNILMRTARRPNYFDEAVSSVMNQTYKNFRILVASEGDSYVKNYPVEVVKVSHVERKNYNHIPWNTHFNQLLDRVTGGWVIYLDDDVLLKPYALETLEAYTDNSRALMIYKYRFPNGRVIPEREFWMRAPVRKHIDTGCFCHHAKYKVRWPNTKAGDWQTVRKLYNIIHPVWIDKVLVTAQNMGLSGKLIDKK
jgi:glycosyltransferase involved in cell wall biosynthesis